MKTPIKFAALLLTVVFLRGLVAAAQDLSAPAGYEWRPPRRPVDGWNLVQIRNREGSFGGEGASVSPDPQDMIQEVLSPYADPLPKYLQFLDGFHHYIHVAIYGYTLPQITQELLKKKAQGLDVEVVADKSQSAGANQKYQLAILRSAGVGVFIGESVDRALMHCKFTVGDDIGVESGSWNYSASASKQDNYAEFIYSQKRAQMFEQYFQRIKSDMGQ